MSSGEQLMRAFNDDVWTGRRNALEAAVLAAAEALLSHTEASGVVLHGEGLEVSIQLVAAQRVNA